MFLPNHPEVVRNVLAVIEGYEMLKAMPETPLNRVMKSVLEPVISNLCSLVCFVVSCWDSLTTILIFVAFRSEHRRSKLQ